MQFFVFSYNRGAYLQNCVESIETCAPAADITIYDDSSDDPATLQILEEIAANHTVVTKPASDASQHGGLYSNMQRALESVQDEQILAFMQDDTQMVRPIRDGDIDFINNYFNQNPKAGFLAPVFLRKITKQKTLNDFHYDPETGVYVCRHDTGKCAGIYYSDIAITTSQRLKDNGWVFQADEMQNENQAKELFTEMGYMYAPFVMWLPNIPAYRYKQKPLAYRLADIVNQSGLYPFEYMTAGSIERLTTRPPEELPIAEHFINTVDKQLKQPWIFHPLKRSRLLRNIDRVDRFIKRCVRPKRVH